MHDLLIARNRDLERELLKVAPLLAADPPFPELSAYVEWMRKYHKHVSEMVAKNLEHLTLEEGTILADIVSDTGQAIQLARLLSTTLLTPILRARATDRLTLRVISWLHNTDSSTRGLPAAFIDGECSVRPMRRPFPPIYSFPSSEQSGLLSQVLHFHEFGHLLYIYHKPELDALVKEIQAGVDEMLMPASFRNDRHAERQAAERRAIVDTWYKWAQELFCDAVGLAIGGPAFLHAFSRHCGWLARENFYRGPDNLRLSEHPVTWLRIETLVARARRMDLAEAAGGIQAEWKQVATAMDATPDYHGFFDARLAPTIERILDDMLIEVSPRAFTPEEVVPDPTIGADTTPVALLNLAWQRFRLTPEDYQDWEERAVTTWLTVGMTH